MIAPTATIATKATNGKRRKIILIRFHFRACATRQILLDDLVWWACAKLRCTQRVASLATIQNLFLSFERASMCTRAARFLPMMRQKVINWVTKSSTQDLLDTCWDIQLQRLPVQLSQVAVVCVRLQWRAQRSNDYLSHKGEIRSHEMH